MAEFDPRYNEYRASDGHIFPTLGAANDHEQEIERRRAEQAQRDEENAEWAKRMYNIVADREELDVLRKLPASVKLFKAGNYDTALPHMESCIPRIDAKRDDYTGKYYYPISEKTLLAINKELGADLMTSWREWVVSLREKVALCYMKQAEQAFANGDYGKALMRCMSCSRYGSATGLDELINKAIDKLSEQAIAGDDKALEVMMKCYDQSSSIGDRPVELCIQLMEQNRPRAAVLLAEYYKNFGYNVGLTWRQRNIEYGRITRRKALYKKAIALYEKEAIASSSADVKKNLKDENKDIRRTIKTMVREYIKRPRKFLGFLSFIVAIGGVMALLFLSMKFFGEDGMEAYFMKIFGEDITVPVIVITVVPFFAILFLFYELWVRRRFIGIALGLLLAATGYIYGVNYFQEEHMTKTETVTEK